MPNGYVKYVGHLYIVDATTLAEVVDLGEFPVVYNLKDDGISMNSGRLSSSYTPRNICEYPTNFEMAILIPAGYAWVSSLENTYPGSTIIEIPSGYDLAAHKFKITFDNGRYLISTNNLSSTANYEFSGYDEYGNLMVNYVPVTIPYLQSWNFSNADLYLFPIYISSIVDGKVDQNGRAYVCSFNIAYGTLDGSNNWCQTVMYTTGLSTFFSTIDPYVPGFPVTYALSGCAGSPSNPNRINAESILTVMNFTANEGRSFTGDSVRIVGTGYPEGEVQFNWNPETGELRVGPVASAISVTVLAKVSDPYADAGTSGEGDGDGTFDFDGDNVTMSTLPAVSFASTGFVRIYNPSLQQLKNLASYMWTDQTFVQTIINHAKQLLENPIESVISLNLLPVQIPNGTAEEVKVLFIPTGVHMPPATTQFVEVDCGSVDLTETYGSALDYSPYTKIHCFLPYIGTVTLDTDEVMGRTISIKYRVDVATGVCVAHILVNGDVYYQFSGHCAVAMPLTSADFSTYISAAIGTAKAVAGVVAAGAGAPGVASALIGTPAPRSSTTKNTMTERNPKTGRQITSGTSTTEHTAQGATFGEIAGKAASNTVGAVMGSKTIVEHSGGFTGNSGYMGVRRPYLVVEIPNLANPKDYGKYNGYPSMITAKLGDCTGYTEVQSVQLTGFKATNPEVTQIGELLKSGVIL